MTGHMTPLDWYVEGVILAGLAVFALWLIAEWARRRVTTAVTSALTAPKTPCRCTACHVAANALQIGGTL